MKIGYARVSTDDQNLNLQLDALAAAGCDKVFQDHVSGATEKRPGLAAALAALQPGDVLIVWRLDRLGRSMPHLVNTVADFAERGIGFQSITEAMDTTTAGGELLFHVMGALAQFERRLNAERSRAGIAAARRRGKHLGRPADLTPEKIGHARQMIDSGEQSVTSIAKILGVHRVHPAQGFEAHSRTVIFALPVNHGQVSHAIFLVCAVTGREIWAPHPLPRSVCMVCLN